MVNKVSYEWVCEIIDSDGDIIDPVFCDDFSTAKENASFSKHDCDIALVRYVGDVDGGETERQYVYVKNNVLPQSFPNGQIVPKRFHKEINSFIVGKR